MTAIRDLIGCGSRKRQGFPILLVLGALEKADTCGRVGHFKESSWISCSSSPSPILKPWASTSSTDGESPRSSCHGTGLNEIDKDAIIVEPPPEGSAYPPFVDQPGWMLLDQHLMGKTILDTDGRRVEVVNDVQPPRVKRTPDHRPCRYLVQRVFEKVGVGKPAVAQE